jgi:hypothetical protein
VAGVVMMTSHFQQARVAISPVDRTDKYPHDQILPVVQWRPCCLAIRFQLTAFPANNGFVRYPIGFEMLLGALTHTGIKTEPTCHRTATLAGHSALGASFVGQLAAACAAAGKQPQARPGSAVCYFAHSSHPHHNPAGAIAL